MRPAPLLAAVFTAVFLSVGAPAFAADKVVQFDRYPTQGTAFDMVWKQWQKVPEYKFYVDAMGGRVPHFALGLADINGDKKPEIFARNNDDELGFCTEDGIACQMHIYVATPQGLIEVGKMMAGHRVVIAANKTDGVNDLIIREPDDKLYTYVWDKNRYKRK